MANKHHKARSTQTELKKFVLRSGSYVHICRHASCEYIVGCSKSLCYDLAAMCIYVGMPAVSTLSAVRGSRSIHPPLHLVSNNEGFSIRLGVGICLPVLLHVIVGTGLAL